MTTTTAPATTANKTTTTSIAFYSAKPYDKTYYCAHLADYATAISDITFIEAPLNADTALLANGHQTVCAFVNDELSEATLTQLAQQGSRLIALRCAGYNQVNLPAAKALGLTVARVPAYSPYAVAEHALALMMTLNRRTHRAYNRVKEGNFSLDGLLGFDMHGKTVGVVGTGNIGEIMTRILHGLGCNVLAHDVKPNSACVERGVTYVTLQQLYADSDIITLHCPLLSDTHHMVNADTLSTMKPGVMLINTSRGGLVDAEALIPALKSGQIGFLGLDVYEEEGPLFFEDKSNTLIQDDVLMRLTSFPNVLITSHQAFFTLEAVTNIVNTTLGNVQSFVQTGQVAAANGL
jgi:D-lactate dehydrogenase